MTEDYKTLEHKKLEIENEMNDLSHVLVLEGNVGMEGNLIDEQGFPRSDIDIYKIRLTRQRLNCLQNDYKTVLDQIEKVLSVKLSTNNNNNDQEKKTNEVISSVNYQANDKLRSFLSVKNISNGSPAYQAGFENNDEIVQFGPFTHTNGSLHEIAEYVKTKISKIILVKVKRSNGSGGTEMKILKLEPNTWSGNGIIGCQFINI